MTAVASGVEAAALGSATAATSSVTVNYTSLYTNSVLFAGFTHNNIGSGDMSAPSGWTYIGRQTYATSSRGVFLYAKENPTPTTSSVVGSVGTATAFAGAVMEVTGLMLPAPFATLVDDNVGGSNATGAFNFALDGTGTLPDAASRPFVCVTVLAANGSLASGVYPNLRILPISGADPPQERTTATATSTAIVMAVFGQSTQTYPIATGGTYYYNWTLGYTTPTRAGGVVTAAFRPATVGMGTGGAGT